MFSEEKKNKIESNRDFETVTKTILKAITDNRSLLDFSPGISKRMQGKITIENLGTVAGNHLFDDHPELFGISKAEGHTFRAFFQRYAGEKGILKVKEICPEFFDEEDPEFIKSLIK